MYPYVPVPESSITCGFDDALSTGETWGQETWDKTWGRGETWDKTWGQTGRTPIIFSRSGNHKAKPEPLLWADWVIPVSFFLWPGYLVS